MIIGVSPFSEAVPGKSSLESLHSKSYAILLGLRVPRTKVPPSTYGSPSVALHRETSIANPLYISHVNREILDLRAWNFSPTEIFFSPSRLQISSCKIIVKKKKKHSYSNSMHSNSTIKKTSAILSRIYSRNISISFHPLSKPPYRSLTKRRNLPFLYSIVIIPKKESVLVVVPLQQEQDWYGYQFPSKETVHTVRVIQFGRRLKKIKPIYPHPKEDDIFSEQRTIRLQRTTVYSPSSNDSFFGATWRLFNRGGGKGRKKREWRRRKRTKEKLELDE